MWGLGGPGAMLNLRAPGQMEWLGTDAGADGAQGAGEAGLGDEGGPGELGGPGAEATEAVGAGSRGQKRQREAGGRGRRRMSAGDRPAARKRLTRGSSGGAEVTARAHGQSERAGGAGQRPPRSFALTSPIPPRCRPARSHIRHASRCWGDAWGGGKRQQLQAGLSKLNKKHTRKS